MKGLLICLLKKEWLDAVRDKRAFMAAMIIALMGPFMLFLMSNIMVDKVQARGDFSIYLKGGEQLIALQQRLGDANIVIAQNKHEEVAIEMTVDDDFIKDMDNAQSAKIYIKADLSEQEIARDVRYVKQVISGYAAELAAMRLMARGIAPDVVRPIRIIEQDTSSLQSKAGFFLSTLASFVLMTVFVSSTNVAIDSSAGERERNSLEFLLAQPVQPHLLVIVKTLNVVFFSLIGAFVTLLLMYITIQYLPLAQLGIKVAFGPLMALQIWSAMVPLGFVAATLQLVTSFKSKSFKEAQSYINMTIIIPVLIPMMINMSGFEHPLLAFLPLTGQVEFVTNIVKGSSVDGLALAVSSVVSMAVAAVLVMVMSKGLKTEKMILGL